MGGCGGGVGGTETSTSRKRGPKGRDQLQFRLRPQGLPTCLPGTLLIHCLRTFTQAAPQAFTLCPLQCPHPARPITNASSVCPSVPSNEISLLCLTAFMGAGCMRHNSMSGRARTVSFQELSSMPRTGLGAHCHSRGSRFLAVPLLEPRLVWGWQNYIWVFLLTSLKHPITFFSQRNSTYLTFTFSDFWGLLQAPSLRE